MKNCDQLCEQLLCSHLQIKESYNYNKAPAAETLRGFSDQSDNHTRAYTLPEVATLNAIYRPCFQDYKVLHIMARLLIHIPFLY